MNTLIEKMKSEMTLMGLSDSTQKVYTRVAREFQSFSDGW